MIAISLTSRSSSDLRTAAQSLGHLHESQLERGSFQDHGRCLGLKTIQIAATGTRYIRVYEILHSFTCRPSPSTAH